MSNNNIYNANAGKGKIFVGMILLLIGGVLLLQQFTYFIIPWWLWRWPTWLILIGLYSGAKNNFRSLGWLIMVAIGGIFLFDDIFPGIHFRNLVWPAVLILVGFWLITGRHKTTGCLNIKSRRRKPWEADYVVKPEVTSPDGTTSTEEPVTGDPFDTKYAYGDDYVNTTSVFGSVNKMILSKDFKGGTVVNVFGGTELNFTQADIKGKVYIDVTQLFGGIKLFVPPHWQVTSDIAAIFAGIDDKRRNTTIPLDPDKVLVLTGTSIFAGIEIRSF
ncbi:cell wall-active antibiotics response protein [Mucilaginibacter sp. RS28]|uniref:Cell wall-active antibiotics response protein n=1 Tax=Mucilaginibacter straminoryzae TaxID=2932774 RepID=A0A9X2B7U4_9SPHI|nr:LiaF domain-containing protein [Mucilaginibacter straminoryzae]MCJ8208756.1 cell wall-active antibiotics response protein [Mucilaginibacter straminoryzae]